MVVYLRLAQAKDLPQIMVIINQAKALLKRDGSPQWQDGKPNQAIFTADIAKQQAYVLIAAGKIAGVAVLMTTPEPTYLQIDGAWKNTVDSYATIHRIAFADQYRGQHLGQVFLANLISRGVFLGIHNFRIDTHALNKRMQHLALSFGYQYRGIIHVNETEAGNRYAYELNLPNN